jgi:tripartite motif-containing protein 71
MARCGTAKLKSALSNRFRAALVAIVALSCAAGGVGQSGNPPANISTGPILSLRLVATVGPHLTDEASLVSPAAVTSNGIGEIFVSDKAANTIYKLSSALELVTEEGSPSSSVFNKPLGMACDAALNVYVADSGNRRLQILDHNLRFVRSVTSYSNQNNESVDFSLPGDITIDGEGNFWIADDKKIVKLDPFFNLLLEVSDNSPSPFIIGKVSSVRVSRYGVAIADIGNRRLAQISTAGNYISEIDLPSPQSVTWDRDGNIWVIEQDRVAAYDIRGNRRFEFSGDEPGARPVWVAFDSSDRLILLDGGLRKVRIYEVIKGAAR